MIDKAEEFLWSQYLEVTGSEPVPGIMFPHVEEVIQNDICPGMALEIPIKSENNSEESYWVAKVTMVCGPLLELQYFGCEDKSKKIWFNLTKEVGHELGWCYKNNKILTPPTNCIIKSSSLDKLEFFVQTAISVPCNMLQGESINMMTRIKQGMKVEIGDPLSPYRLWMATIVKNIGGRLLLSYDTPGSPVKDFWIFCTSELIHDYGFVKKCSSPWFLDPPSSIKNNHSSDEWIDFVKSYLLSNRTNNNLFNKKGTTSKHNFKLGMKLEALSPYNYTDIHPATVTNVLDDKYFLVSIDESMKVDTNNDNRCIDISKTWLCTFDHPYIFPINWAKQNDIKLILPTGWTNNNNEYFDWNSYLNKTNAKAANETLFYIRENALDNGYTHNMRLEAVDPLNESHICAAHISKILNDLIFLKLDSEDNRPEHIIHIHSPTIFPVGWCEANQYPLRLPKDYNDLLRKQNSSKEVVQSVMESNNVTNLTKIYFNSRCSTGPMISKSKLTTLPKSVGPGPVDLVLKEVLTMIVSIGYNSARVLKVLQCDTPIDPGYNVEMLKVKMKNSRYHASVAVVNDSSKVENFCRTICKKIMVCPNLFGPTIMTEDDQCPEKCRKLRGRGKWVRKRGRQPNKDKNVSTLAEPGEREDESSTSDASVKSKVKKTKKPKKKKLLNNSNKIKTDIITSDTSDGSNNDRGNKLKKKDKSDSSSTKSTSLKGNNSPKTIKYTKRKREPESTKEIESTECMDSIESEYTSIRKRQRSSNMIQLDSNPLFWSVDEVYNFLRKTTDCKDVADAVKKEEIDGMAFLLLNLPTLVEHMKLNQNDALNLCKHIEQVKVTFYLRHVKNTEPEM